MPEQQQSSSIYHTLSWCTSSLQRHSPASHRKLCNFAEPKIISWAKLAHFEFYWSNFLLCRIAYEHRWRFRPTLEGGPRSRDQMNSSKFFLVESLINWSQGLLDEGPRPKSGKLRLKATWHLSWGEKIQLVRTKKTVLKGELLIWGN